MAKLKDPNGEVFEIADAGVDALKALGWTEDKPVKPVKVKKEG